MVHKTLSLQAKLNPVVFFELRFQIDQVSLCTAIRRLHFDSEVMVSFGSDILSEQFVNSLIDSVDLFWLQFCRIGEHFYRSPIFIDSTTCIFLGIEVLGYRRYYEYSD